MVKVCAFTGPRPEKCNFSDDDLDDRFKTLQEVIRKQIIDLYYEGYEFFLTGMSRGVDMWCAEVVLYLQDKLPSLKLIAVIPFQGQEELWSNDYKREYYHILDNCYKVINITPTIKSSTYLNQCYLNRNRFMVDKSQVLLAVYSDKTADVRSGTRATVNFARRLNRRIIYIHPLSFEISEKRYAHA